jgi:succinate dehydrogenase / fumarate reductase flavoprotein subunit
MDLHSMEIRSFPADAVVLATGGPGLVYGRSTNSMVNNGSAAVSVYKQGAKYANGEFIQIHPTAIPGWDKHRLMSESARGEGGRVWVPKKKGDTRDPRQIPEDERWYFLEEKYPRFGNLVPRDVAAKEIYHVCVDLEMGIDGENMVFLDLTHKSRQELDRKLGGIMEIYEKFVGEDPRDVPMRIFPAVHYSMGGLWVDYERDEEGRIVDGSPRNQMTNIPGLYAVGEVDYQYHGANRLGANSLLSCIYGGLLTGPAVNAYLGNLSKRAVEQPETLFQKFSGQWVSRFDEIRAMNGKLNPYQLHQELGELMLSNVLIVRHNDRLEKTLATLDTLQERWKECGNLDGAGWANDSLRFMHHLWFMFELAKVITKGALLRNECRGAHYKPEFEIEQPAGFKPDSYLKYTESVSDPAFNGDESQLGFSPEHLDYMRRFKAQNDEWLKSTIAVDRDGVPEISYEEIDTSLVPPRPRKYD